MDFSSILEKYLSEGYSAEAVATAFTDALNNAENNKSKKERDKYLASLREQLKEAVKSDTMDYNSASAALQLAVAAYCPEWSLEQLKTFGNSYMALVKCTIKNVKWPDKETSTKFKSMFEIDQDEVASLLKLFLDEMDW